MGSLAHDYDLLLEAPSPVDAALAKDLLAEHGIPSFTAGRDRDMAELGVGVHNALTRPDLFVPKGMREKARAVLDEAWSAERIEAPELAVDDPEREREVASSARERTTRFGWIAILAFVVIAAVVAAVLAESGSR